MTAWLARLGFLLMYAAIPCLVMAAVTAAQSFAETGHAGTGFVAWQLAVVPLVVVGAALVHLAAAIRRRR